MKIIVGLGNPGGSYTAHRHNVGFRVVDLLGERHAIRVAKRSFGALTGGGAIEGEAVLLAKPQTYMNLSGDAVAPLLRYYRLEAEDLIVVHDDLDIELGRMKLGKGSGHGGHNGLRSIVDVLGTNDFFRVRIGIGRPPPGVDGAGYVLAAFAGEEEKTAAEICTLAADAVEMILAKGLAAAQQKYH